MQHHPLVERAFRELFPAREIKMPLHLRYSGHFRGYNAHVEKDWTAMTFSLSREWEGVSDEIQIGLIQHLLSKLYKVKRKTHEMAMYDTFLKEMTIPSGTYFNVPLTKTLSVGCQWLVSAEIAEDVVYQLVEALWDRRIKKLIKAGHAKGSEIKLRLALEEVAQPPLHPGAERFYQEQGFIWMTLRGQEG